MSTQKASRTAFPPPPDPDLVDRIFQFLADDPRLPSMDAKMLAAVKESHRQLICYLESLSADEYAQRAKLRSLLRTEAKDEEVHRRQVEAFCEGLAAV